MCNSLGPVRLGLCGRPTMYGEEGLGSEEKRISGSAWDNCIEKCIIEPVISERDSFHFFQVYESRRC